jgi:hypothetical protein
VNSSGTAFGCELAYHHHPTWCGSTLLLSPAETVAAATLHAHHPPDRGCGTDRCPGTEPPHPTIGVWSKPRPNTVHHRQHELSGQDQQNPPLTRFTPSWMPVWAAPEAGGSALSAPPFRAVPQRRARADIVVGAPGMTGCPASGSHLRRSQQRVESSPVRSRSRDRPTRLAGE